MKFLALEHEVAGTAASGFAPLLAAEAARVWDLYKAGVVRETYFRTDRHDAVLVLECAGADEALAALATLPLVAAGLISFELIPLTPYDGFARLFSG